jgi:hypothetical protein
MRAGGRTLAAVAGQSLRAAHGSAPEPAPPQGQNLSGKKKAGIFIGIAGALAAIIFVIAGQEDEEVIEEPCPNIIVSGVVIPPC